MREVVNAVFYGLKTVHLRFQTADQLRKVRQLFSLAISGWSQLRDPSVLWGAGLDATDM